MRDSEIVASIVAGDPGGLAAAYDRYADALYKYCRSLLSEPDAPADAANAVQDTFLIAPSRLAGLSDPGLLRAWLYAVGRSECQRILRSRKTAPALPETPAEADAVIDITEGSAERARLRALLADTAHGLNPDERELLELQLRHGLDPGEVAAVLDVSADHVYVLSSKAHEQLEACLAVLLVGRSRRGDCDKLEALLADWDGQLTVPLRKRVYRHIDSCSTCHTRLDLELRPAVLLGWPPDAAMAAAATESFRLAPGAPEGLREHTLSLAADQDSAAMAHRAAVSGRAGTFGRDGFPERQRHTGAIGGLRSLPRARVAVAAVVLAAVAATATVLALSGGTGRPALAAGQQPGASIQATAGGAGQQPAPPATATPAGTRTPATGKAAPRTAPPASGVATQAPAPAPQGTVSVSVGGSGPLQPGTALTLNGDGSTPVTLTASGGPVNWSVTVSGGPPGHQVSVTGPSSGTLQPGQSAQVTIAANKTANGSTLTVNPGGAAYPLVVN
jgi:RNA polymerase sigma factor (sigma-70 family)